MPHASIAINPSVIAILPSSGCWRIIHVPGWRSEVDTTLRVMLVTFLPNEKVATVVAAEDQHGVTNAIAGAAKWQDRQ